MVIANFFKKQKKSVNQKSVNYEEKKNYK